ncbi:MAG: hypothetical protein OXI70_14085 [Chloroflexota bacterium]|nr:hypothetical protein [Chloroflexota bacterium]
MRYRVFLVLAAITLCGCQVAAGQWHFSPAAGEAMIGLCQREYTKHTGRVLGDEADRVYVYSRWDVSWIVFSKGERGSFGEPEYGFKTHLRCAIATKPRLRVELMDQGTFAKIIDLEPKSFEEFRYLDEFPIVSLYVRDGSGFSYSKSRPTLSREELNERINRMYDSLDVPEDEILVIQ